MPDWTHQHREEVRRTSLECGRRSSGGRDPEEVIGDLGRTHRWKEIAPLDSRWLRKKTRAASGSNRPQIRNRGPGTPAPDAGSRMPLQTKPKALAACLCVIGVVLPVITLALEYVNGMSTAATVRSVYRPLWHVLLPRHRAAKTTFWSAAPTPGVRKEGELNKASQARLAERF